MSGVKKVKREDGSLDEVTAMILQILLNVSFMENGSAVLRKGKHTLLAT